MFRVLTLLFCLCCSASAQTPQLAPYQPLQSIPELLKSTVPAPAPAVDSWLLADFDNGWILADHNPHTRIEPASLTKLMTSYLTFEALKKQEIARNDLTYISEKAWKSKGSRMFIEVDTQVSIDDLIKGLVVQSGNDAAVALAEHISGSEAHFVARMNRTASELGMINTHFANSNGLPDERQYSSLADMVLLSMALIRRFPDDYTYYSIREFTYNNITQPNRNVLLRRDPTVDGIKTGYTRKAGYCLIGTAERDGLRLIAAVAGAKSARQRANMVQSLLQYGYASYENNVLYEPEAVVQEVALLMGQVPYAQTAVNRRLAVLFPKGTAAALSSRIDLPAYIEAPQESGSRIGLIEMRYDEQVFLQRGLYLHQAYPEGPWWSRLLDYAKKLLR